MIAFWNEAENSERFRFIPLALEATRITSFLKLLEPCKEKLASAYPFGMDEDPGARSHIRDPCQDLTGKRAAQDITCTVTRSGADRTLSVGDGTSFPGINRKNGAGLEVGGASRKGVCLDVVLYVTRCAKNEPNIAPLGAMFQSDSSVGCFPRS